MTALAKARSKCERQTYSLAKDNVTQGLRQQVFSWKIQILVVGLKGMSEGQTDMEK
jgi:hypothetical protein